MAAFDPSLGDAFLEAQHVKYLIRIARDRDSFEYVVSQHLRMSGIYWGLTAMCILGRNLKEEMDSDAIVEWVLTCQNEDGGFGGCTHHDSHILYTLSALQILAICDRLDAISHERVATYVAGLQQPDGSFVGDCWGEVDTRFSYCALSSLAILGQLRSGLVDVSRAVSFISRNFDGGYGAVPGAESHAGQIFCCVGALSICEAVTSDVDVDLLGWWLSERQCDSGGLNGRPEKQADVCYSWWILSCLSIIGRLSWIDRQKLIRFITQCQDEDDGGIADRPGNMADVFHTFFGICGFSLMGCFAKPVAEAAVEVATLKPSDGTTARYATYREIDPTYALPRDVVERLRLPHETLRQI